MTKVLVLYYSMYGHIETMAKAVAEGADGSHHPSEKELTIDRFQGKHVAEIAKKQSA